MDIKISLKEYAEFTLCKTLVDFSYNELKSNDNNFSKKFIERYEAMNETLAKWEEGMKRDTGYME